MKTKKRVVVNNIHPLSDVQSQHIGLNTRVWQYCVILEGAKIGCNCNICSHVFIENHVLIGDGVTIKFGAKIPDGVTLEENSFIGPNVSFTNDKYPRSKKDFIMERTNVGRGASIGAGSIIVGPVNIGEFAMLGAGSVVTKDIPSYSLALGNPARTIGNVNDMNI